MAASQKAKSKPKKKSKLKLKTTRASNRTRKSASALASGLRTLELEAEGLSSLKKEFKDNLKEPFEKAVAILAKAKGRVIVTGIGKSGHIGQKIAATFASTGTPAFFVHPTEASHGDLGMVASDDVVLALSWSGETVELKSIITYARRFSVKLISITSKRTSALGAQSDVCLELPRAKEACPHGLAPTTSTTMQLALGDCLAIALLEAKGFTAHDFKVFHPGGSLGANLKYLNDMMHKSDQLPLARDTQPMADVLVTMTAKAFGCVGITNAKGNLVGIITDGDLRRHMGEKLLATKTKDVMTKKPKTAKPNMLASAALELMNSSRITALFVVEKGKPVGIVHVHDFLRSGVV